MVSDTFCPLQTYLRLTPRHPDPTDTSTALYVQKWMKTSSAVLFCLSNDTIQVNFYDTTFLMFSALTHEVAYINKQGVCERVRLAVVSTTRPDITKRLTYAKDILQVMLAPKKSSVRK